jgi:hypothetical protein
MLVGFATPAAHAAPSKPKPKCAGERATLVGTRGDDVLRAGKGPQVIVGKGGDDRIVAGRGDDTICGGSGTDVLAGGKGADHMVGGPGRKDRCLGGKPTNDRIRGRRADTAARSCEIVRSAVKRDPDPSGQPDPGPVNPFFFGINADVALRFELEQQGNDPYSPYETDYDVDRVMSHLKGTAVGFVRAAPDWRRIQPSAGVFNWVEHDEWVEVLAANGLRWAPTLLGIPAPNWAVDPSAVAAGCGFRSPPAQASSFANYAYQFTLRYGRNGTFWKEHPSLPYLPVVSYEIWNEPNHSAYWCPFPSPRKFGDLLAATGQAIHAADNSAITLFGGLAPFPTSEERWMSSRSFLRRVGELRPGLVKNIDAIGHHAFPPKDRAIVIWLERLRDEIDDSAFTGKPMIVNEFGWPRAGTQGGFTVVTDESERGRLYAEFARRAALHHERLNIAGIAAYAWITEQRNTLDQEDWFGLAAPYGGGPFASGIGYLLAAGSLSR